VLTSSLFLGVVSNHLDRVALDPIQSPFIQSPLFGGMTADLVAIGGTTVDRIAAHWLADLPWLGGALSSSLIPLSQTPAPTESFGGWMTSILLGLVVGGILMAVINRLMSLDAKSQSKRVLDQAQLEADNLIKKAELEKKERLMQMQSAFDAESKKQREELRSLESQVLQKEQSIKQSAEDLKKQERLVESNQRKLAEKLDDANKKNDQFNKLIAQAQSDLQRVTGMSKDEAKQQLMGLLEKELQGELGTVILRHEKKVNETAQQKAQDILLTAMQRYASAQTSESTTSTIDIPNDDMKGRIIGREGRNIRAFEKSSGCDLIIDDTPGVVIVSGFDPVRREIARQSMAKLVTDGRIHPTRIEEIIAATEKEMDAFIRRKGEEAAQEVNLQGLHERVIEMLGRLHFRTSYSQNVLRHSVEVAFLSGLMAEMIGLNPNVARRCGLLHDIGKAADHELEGGHPKIGADLLKRSGENEHVVHAALGHHDQLTTDHPYTLLVATADACSASRPGARRESLERYIKRMEELESIAKGFQGVEQAFAIQAGRELRVIVSSKDTDDSVAAKVCRDIAKAFEEQLTYPGEIKVTVVRESRFVEIAR
jgi:ribonucrease Y